MSGEMIRVHPEGGMPIPLTRRQDTYQNDFFTGVCQFPGNLDFETGIRFKAFVTDPGEEVLEICVLNSEVRQDHRSVINVVPGCMQVKMHPERERGDLIYVGDAICPVSMPTIKGIWIVLFIQQGREELQMSRLKHSLNRPRQNLMSSTG